MLGSEGQRLFLVKSAVLISQHFFILSRSMNDTYYTLRFDEKNRMKIDFLRANMHKFSRQITKYGSRLSHLTIFLTLATNPLGFSSFFSMGAKNARIRRPETWVTT